MLTIRITKLIRQPMRPGAARHRQIQPGIAKRGNFDGIDALATLAENGKVTPAAHRAIYCSNMKLRRSHRLVAALIALASLLFMQLAVAAYACPMLSPQTVSPPPMRMAMADCHGMDKQSPSLCGAQSDTGKQSPGKPATPHVEPFVAAAVLVEVAAIEPLMPASASVAPSSIPAAGAAPPIAIRHCCLRL
jgi:hypothetical protein